MPAWPGGARRATGWLYPAALAARLSRSGHGGQARKGVRPDTAARGAVGPYTRPAPRDPPARGAGPRAVSGPRAAFAAIAEQLFVTEHTVEKH